MADDIITWNPYRKNWKFIKSLQFETAPAVMSRPAPAEKFTCHCCDESVKSQVNWVGNNRVCNCCYRNYHLTGSHVALSGHECIGDWWMDDEEDWDMEVLGGD